MANPPINTPGSVDLAQSRRAMISSGFMTLPLSDREPSFTARILVSLRSLISVNRACPLQLRFS
jgi:hypothetical protein